MNGSGDEFQRLKDAIARMKVLMGGEPGAVATAFEEILFHLHIMRRELNDLSQWQKDRSGEGG